MVHEDRRRVERLLADDHERVSDKVTQADADREPAQVGRPQHRRHAVGGARGGAERAGKQLLQADRRHRERVRRRRQARVPVGLLRVVQAAVRGHVPARERARGAVQERVERERGGGGGPRGRRDRPQVRRCCGVWRVVCLCVCV